ncbi:unnamed protein product [Lymnaea stagnalis]|uniref:Paraoxonase n=1 Tax=Lymnaea stagnalis TaxID=6523 RepID=A0AAV2HHF1_LYMST
MYLKIAVLSICLFVLQHVIRLIYSLGFHLHYYQHYPGSCYQLDGIEYGSQNFHTLPDGKTFVTSGLNMNLLSQSFQAHYKNSNVSGAIYTVSLSENSAKVVKLDIRSDGKSFKVGTFRPHGISVWPNNYTGQHVVYVVNHPAGESDRIEKFHFNQSTGILHHIKTYTSSKLRFLYDVQALGEDSFYTTNILYEHKVRFFMLLELFSLMPWSSVMMYSGETGYQEVITGLTSATGIAMSGCGSFVYVSLSLSSEIRVYARQKDNSLTLQQSYPLYTHPDNVVLDPTTGDLFIGSHPIAYQYLKHLDKPKKFKAASQVLHLRTAEGIITSATELLYDDGDLLSGSSAAVVYNKKLLIGSAVEKLVLCEVSVPI